MIDSLHHIGATIHVPASQTIDAVLATNTKLDLLGPFAADNIDVDAIHISNTIYLTSPFLGIFLERNLTPVKAWSCLRDAIVDARAAVGCRPIIYWFRVTLTSNSG